MSWSRQKPTNTSLRNSLPLSMSIPRSGNGSAPRNWVSASTTRRASRTRSGTHSVHPLAMSVSTSVQTKLPDRVPPEWAKRSASTNPGAGSFQSPKVQTGTWLRRPLKPGPPPALTGRYGARRRRLSTGHSRVNAALRSIDHPRVTCVLSTVYKSRRRTLERIERTDRRGRSTGRGRQRSSIRKPVVAPAQRRAGGHGPWTPDGEGVLRRRGRIGHSEQLARLRIAFEIERPPAGTRGWSDPEWRSKLVHCLIRVQSLALDLLEAPRVAVESTTRRPLPPTRTAPSRVADRWLQPRRVN